MFLKTSSSLYHADCPGNINFALSQRWEKNKFKFLAFINKVLCVFAPFFYLSLERHQKKLGFPLFTLIRIPLWN
ncbi:hypothetical protein QQP08_018714 [Theobroma cacao]|nr:hypothetical protein QQP08_018714 [Theobroma cacao]